MLDTLESLIKKGICSQVEDFLRIHSLVAKDDLANALSTAVLRGDLPITILLLDNGADPNVRPTEHLPPLHCAIEQQNAHLVRLLAEHGADINLPTENGFSPLHLAVDIEGDSAWQSGRISSGDLTALLLELGADPEARDTTGKTPLNIAEQYQHTAAMRLLTRTTK